MLLLCKLSAIVDSCPSTTRRSPVEIEGSSWASETVLVATQGVANSDQTDQHIGDQIGYSSMSGSNVFMDLKQVGVHIDSRLR